MNNCLHIFGLYCKTVKQYRIFIFLFVYILFPLSSFAEDATQWRVSEGDEASFGPSAVNAITFSPDGTRLAVASVNGITVYDTYTGEAVALLPSSMRHVTTLAFSPDSRIVASATEDATLHLWNVHTSEHITEFTNPAPVVALAFSADGNTLAGGSLKEIRLWDLTVGQVTHATVLHGHRDMVTTLAFSPDSKTLASASFYGTILLWDLDSSQLRHRLSAHVDSIQTLVFSPDNQTLASGGYWDSDAESTIHVWSTQTGQLLTTFENHTIPVFALAFASDVYGIDRRTLVSAGWDNAIRMWDLHTGQLQAIFGGNTAPVIALAFLPDTQSSDGKTLASVSLDGTIQLRRLTASLTGIPSDVNDDGVVNILDLTFIASRFGQASPDLNGDGIVNILDLTIIANRIGK